MIPNQDEYPASEDGGGLRRNFENLVPAQNDLKDKSNSHKPKAMDFMSIDQKKFNLKHKLEAEPNKNNVEVKNYKSDAVMMKAGPLMHAGPIRKSGPVAGGVPMIENAALEDDSDRPLNKNANFYVQIYPPQKPAEEGSRTFLEEVQDALHEGVDLDEQFRILAELEQEKERKKQAEIKQKEARIAEEKRIQQLKEADERRHLGILSKSSPTRNTNSQVNMPRKSIRKQAYIPVNIQNFSYVGLDNLVQSDPLENDRKKKKRRNREDIKSKRNTVKSKNNMQQTKPQVQDILEQYDPFSTFGKKVEEEKIGSGFEDFKKQISEKSEKEESEHSEKVIKLEEVQQKDDEPQQEETEQPMQVQEVKEEEKKPSGFNLNDIKFDDDDSLMLDGLDGEDEDGSATPDDKASNQDDFSETGHFGQGDMSTKSNRTNRSLNEKNHAEMISKIQDKSISDYIIRLQQERTQLLQLLKSTEKRLENRAQSLDRANMDKFNPFDMKSNSLHFAFLFASPLVREINGSISSVMQLD